MTNIVMLCRDRLRLTEQALDSLYSNTPAESFNLTLIDDASEDFRVRRLLLKYGSRSNATLLRIETSSHVLARAKNLGVHWSFQTFGAGEWLYLSDNDVFFQPGWLEILHASAMSGEIHGFKLFGGQVHPYHLPESNMFITIGERFKGIVLRERLMLDGPSWLLRWKTWRSLHGLRGSEAGVCRGEDVDFCQRLVQAGGRIGVVSPHCVIHTGLTNSAGQDAPGRPEREKLIPLGVLAE